MCIKKIINKKIRYMKTVSKILKSASEFLEASSTPVLFSIVCSFFLWIFTVVAVCFKYGFAAALVVCSVLFTVFSSGRLIGRYEGRCESAKKKQEAMEGQQ